MDDLEAEFHSAIHAQIQEALKLGYNPTAWVEMLARYGVVDAARRLIVSGDIQSGFSRLQSLGRIDLTVEKLMTSERFRELFKRAELQAAEWRLEQVQQPLRDLKQPAAD